MFKQHKYCHKYNWSYIASKRHLPFTKFAWNVTNKIWKKIIKNNRISALKNGFTVLKYDYTIKYTSTCSYIGTF
jgi:hypothetical protein